MKLLRAASATALALLLFSSGGCAKVIGLDSFSETDEAAEEGGDAPEALSCDLPRISNSCANCLHTACADECRSCQGNPDCESILDCTEECDSGDATCFNACIQEHPDGAEDFLNLYADPSCAFTTCRLACLGRRGDALEPCNLGEQCASGLCTGRTGGWCTAQCATTAECGSAGVCVPNNNGINICFLACVSDDDCYPGLICQGGTDVGRVPIFACAAP